MEIKRTFTRKELYELVWSTPISKLAQSFDISDRGLAKTCERHHIPVPGRGYWARVEAGQQATKTPLWKIDNPSIETVYIGEFKRAISSYTASQIEATKKAVEEHTRRAHSSEPVVPTPAVRKEGKESKLVDLPEFDKPHPAIKMLASQLRAAKPDEIGGIHVSGIKINQLSRQRVTTFLNHLATKLEPLGIALSPEHQEIQVSLGQDSTSFTITETRRKEKHVPTQAELEKKRKHDRRRGNSWDFWPERFWPEFDYFHVGTLSFDLSSYADGARRRWSDAKTQRLEGLLEAIVEGLHYHLQHQRLQREEREEKERYRLHMAGRRELHKKRQEREKKRLQFLEHLADYQREAADLRRTLSNAEAAGVDAPPEYRRMIEWTRKRLEFIEAKNEVAVLAETLRANELFPEIDPFLDPEGDPPPKQNHWDP